VLACSVVVGCSKSETPAPASSPHLALTVTPAVTPAANEKSGESSSPATRSSPDPSVEADVNDVSNLVDWEWNLAEEADTDEFEIDADATSYFMPAGNVVGFKATALNGTPPFAYTWDFKDGTPLVKGDLVKHKFERAGKYEIQAIGTDASGAKSVVTLAIGVRGPVEFAILMQADPKDIQRLKDAYPDDPVGKAWGEPTAIPTP
jgi:hypothetical protein